MCLPVHRVMEEVVAAEHQDASHAETEREKHLARCVDPQLGGEKTETALLRGIFLSRRRVRKMMMMLLLTLIMIANRQQCDASLCCGRQPTLKFTSVPLWCPRKSKS